MNKNKDYTFYWEEPKKKRKIRFEEVLQPIEISFNIPIFEHDISVEIYERDKELIIVAKVPGFKKKEINFKISKDYLEILAKKTNETIDKKDNMYSKSYSSKTFHKRISLPYEIDEKNVYSITEDEEIKIIVSRSAYKKKRKIKADK